VAKKTKKTTDRPGSELSFQSVNEISSIGMLDSCRFINVFVF
jgi:hypothetical protein